MSQDEQQNTGIVYLGAPYTHLRQDIRLARFESVTRAAAKLIETGRIVYSPLTMTHPIDLVLANEGDTLGSDYWVRFDEAFMAFCSEMIVLRLSGWELSSGVAREIRYFKDKGRPISYIDPDENIPDVPVPLA
jgi:Domain of unknown function (DUF1937)